MDDTDKIQILDFIVFRGRNIYSHRPIVKMIVDIGKYQNIPSNNIPGFNDRVVNAFPGLKKDYCGLGYEGGFLERLRDGTYLAHILEHVILAMQASLGYDIRLGKTRFLEEPSTYSVVYEYSNEVAAIECGKAAVFILNAFIQGEDIDAGEFIDYLKDVAAEAELGPSTSAIVEEAKKIGLPVTRIGNGSLVQISYGRKSRLVEATLTDFTSCISADISSNKHLTKSILDENKIPVPIGKVVYSEISAVMFAKRIGMPVVLKPLDGNQGKGVHLNLTGEGDIRAAFREASKYSTGVIVEKYIYGKDYRILVIGNQVKAVSERKPANVTGDGVHTVKELVEKVNQDPRRGKQHEKQMTIIQLDPVAKNVLQKSGMTEESVPRKGQEVRLRDNGNLSTGGTAIDCTDMVHPDNANIAVRAANAIGIDIAGIDVVTEDISKSIVKTGGAVVEVNTAPGIRMHLYPSAGKPRNVAKDIIEYLFPDEASRTFPIVSVTGSRGTAVARIIAHVLTNTGLTVGMTCSEGTYINGKCILEGNQSDPLGAKTLLSDKRVDAAVLETGCEGMILGGLGYDLADIGVITDVSTDGPKNSETLENNAWILSLVTEAVKRDGYAVLNAEDPMTPSILQRVKAQPVFFCKNPAAAIPYASAAGQEILVFTDNGWIKVKNRNEEIRIIRLQDIPPVQDDDPIECFLASVAALYAMHVSPDIIRAGFK